MCSKRTRYSPFGVLAGILAVIVSRPQVHHALLVNSAPWLQT